MKCYKINFKEKSGKTNEILFDKNKRRDTTGASYLVNRKLRARFVYERYPNGTIKRTLAYRPDGTLLAEYPNRFVDIIRDDGRATDGHKSAVYTK